MPSEHYVVPEEALELHRLLKNGASTVEILHELASIRSRGAYEHEWMNENLWDDHELGRLMAEFFHNLPIPSSKSYEDLLQIVCENLNCSVDDFGTWMNDE